MVAQAVRRERATEREQVLGEPDAAQAERAGRGGPEELRADVRAGEEVRDVHHG